LAPDTGCTIYRDFFSDYFPKGLSKYLFRKSLKCFHSSTYFTKENIKKLPSVDIFVKQIGQNRTVSKGKGRKAWFFSSGVKIKRFGYLTGHSFFLKKKKA